jgi:hypothetical protein
VHSSYIYEECKTVSRGSVQVALERTIRTRNIDAQTAIGDLQKLAEGVAERDFHASSARVEAARRQQWEAEDALKSQFFERHSLRQLRNQEGGVDPFWQRRVQNDEGSLVDPPWQRQVKPRSD